MRRITGTRTVALALLLTTLTVGGGLVAPSLSEASSSISGPGPSARDYLLALLEHFRPSTYAPGATSSSNAAASALGHDLLGAARDLVLATDEDDAGAPLLAEHLAQLTDLYCNRHYPNEPRTAS